jgi:hypothetical protein
MAENCYDKIMSPEVQKALFGDRPIPKAAVSEVLNGIEKIKMEFDAGGLTEPQFNQKIEAYILRRRELNSAQLQIMKDEAIKRKDILKRVMDPAYAERPVEGFWAELTGSKIKATGGQNSVGPRAKALAKRYREFFVGKMAQAGDVVQNAATTGVIDDDAVRVMYALANNSPIPEGLGAEAQAFGKAVHEVNALKLRDMQDRNIPIKQIKNYISSQQYDPKLVKSAGIDKIVSFLQNSKSLDRARFYGDLPKEAKAAASSMRATERNTFYEIASGVGGLDSIVGDKIVGDHYVGIGGRKNLADKMALSRNIQFDDPEEFLAWRKLTSSSTLIGDVMRDNSRTALHLTVYERLGNQPRATLDTRIDKAIERYRADGNEKAAQSLMGAKSHLLRALDSIMHETAHPGNATLTAAGNIAHNVTQMSTHGAVWISQLTDWAAGILATRNATGQNLGMVTGEYVTRFLAEFPEEYKQAFMKEAEYGLNALVAQEGVAGRGRFERGTAAGARNMFRLLPNNAIDESAHAVVAGMLTRDWARAIDTPFEKLNKHMWATLKEVNVTSEDWQAMKHMLQTDPGTGNPMVDIGSYGAIPDDVAAKGVKAAKVASGKKVTTPTEKELSVYKSDLATRLRTALVQLEDQAAIIASPRANTLFMGTERGTFSSEFMRLVMQLKSFTIQSYNMTDRFLNSGIDEAAMARGELRGKKDYEGLGAYLVGGSVLGLAGLILRHKLNGKPPPDFNDIQTYLKAVATSPAGGLHADFFLGEWDKYSFAEQLVGPTFSRVGKLAKAGTEIRKGVLENDPKQRLDGTLDAVNVLRSLVPFQQALGAKQAVDYMHHSILEKALDPAGAARRERRNQIEEARKNR